MGEHTSYMLISPKSVRPDTLQGRWKMMAYTPAEGRCRGSTSWMTDSETCRRSPTASRESTLRSGGRPYSFPVALGLSDTGRKIRNVAAFTDCAPLPPASGPFATDSL